MHLVWNSGTEDALRYARSVDGGATWSAPRIIHTYKPFGTKSTINGQTNSRVKGVVRAECYPTLTIDNTGGARNGWLYLTWAADNYPNVYFSRSTDNGTTWSPARIVHSDTTNDQFWSWISLDPTSGEIAIMYSDSRDDVDNILVNTYVSWSSDGGTTWLDRRIGDDVNDLRRNPFQGNTFAGDYSGCDFYNGVVYPSWVDMRNTYVNPADNDVFTAIVDTRPPGALPLLLLQPFPTVQHRSTSRGLL
ncbi:MAG: exo-alpha-sialidase [Ignavibacteria bacterium]|nr:exo-alpha-sialidase [Ignavibacteria bacterium]